MARRWRAFSRLQSNHLNPSPSGEGRSRLLARRLDRLEALRETLAPETVVRTLDVGERDAAVILEHVLEELGGVDLAIISAGTGHNAALHWELDVETVTVNVLGFMAVAHVAMRTFSGEAAGT